MSGNSHSRADSAEHAQAIRFLTAVIFEGFRSAHLLATLVARANPKWIEASTDAPLRILKKRILRLASAEELGDQTEMDTRRKRAELADIQSLRGQASKNLARANSDEQYQDVATVFEQLGEQIKSNEADIAIAEGQLKTETDVSP